MNKIHDITEVAVAAGYRLRLRFSNGFEGEVDIASMIPFDGVFAALKDPETFARVRVDRELGTIVWPGGVDLDPIELYRRAAEDRMGPD